MCRKVFKTTNIKVDDTVVFHKASYGLMIKTVTSINHQTYFVEGTNPLSIDSRNFGSLEHNEIHYKVLFKIPLF